MDSNAELAVHRLWEQQSRQAVVAAADIRAKAERLDAETRRRRVWTGALFVLIILIEAWQVWTQEALLERAGDSLTIAALLYVVYRFRRQRMATPPVVLGRTNSVEFCRAELVRQRDLSKDSWGYLLPFVPGVTLALVGRGLAERPLGQNVAVIMFGIALFLGVAWWNAHVARRLHREIDEVDGSSA